MNEIDVLFINPPSAFGAYTGTRVNAAVQIYPLSSFMSLSAVLKRAGFQPAVLDLGIEKNPYQALDEFLKETKPRIVGLTSTTPLFFEVAEISRRVKEKFGSDITVVYGGPHATALPEESLRNSDIDIVVISEGEEIIVEIAQGKKLADIKGIYYKENGKILSTPSRPLIKDLNSLPLPDISVYNIKKYKSSRLVSRGTPSINLETSRGCPHNCSFCNKNIFGRLFRPKSPERAIEEIKYFLKSGVKGIRIADDKFTVDIERAKKFCELILKEKLRFPWSLAAGIRVDRTDKELEDFLRLAKKAGCHEAGIGFESGDQKSLDSIDKGITLEQSIKCMEIVKRAGMESIGFFIFGLPADTEESLKKTMDFALKLRPDLAKVTIAMPFPGTRLFEQWDKEGRIKTRDWSKYNLHKVADVYEHPNLSQETLKKYYYLFYRKFYFNFRFLSRRIIKGLLNGRIFLDIYYGFRTFIS